jgi:hypothetical protein
LLSFSFCDEAKIVALKEGEIFLLLLIMRERNEKEHHMFRRYSKIGKLKINYELK